MGTNAEQHLWRDVLRAAEPQRRTAAFSPKLHLGRHFQSALFADTHLFTFLLIVPLTALYNILQYIYNSIPV